MKKLVPIFLVILCLAGCSMPTIETPTPEETEKAPLISYESAFDYIKNCEENIIDSNKDNFNKYNESAAEKLIYSDEYAALYCSYWKALEVLEGENDSRFEKSKMRWQFDYSNEEWTNLLVNALETEGVSGLHDEYYRLYSEEVFPKVEYRWRNGID